MRKKPRVVFFENPADVPNSRLTVLIFRSVLAPGIPAKDLSRNNIYNIKCFELHFVQWLTSLLSAPDIRP
jgi:hypothetical protein